MLPLRGFPALGSFRPPVPPALVREQAAVLRLTLSIKADLSATGSPAHDERLSWDFVPYDTLQLGSPLSRTKASS